MGARKIVIKNFETGSTSPDQMCPGSSRLWAFKEIFDDGFKFDMKFWNRKYVFKTGSPVQNHDFEL